MRKRRIAAAWFLAALMCCQPLYGFGQTRSVLPEPDRRVIVDDAGEYEELEILALWDDGTLEVYSCGSESELCEKLAELAALDSVAVLQPNYRYKDQALSVNDAEAAEQWAFQNDGTFEIEVEQNRYPVFRQPFGEPAAPGEWQGDERMEFMGVLVQTERKTAVSGVDIRLPEAWSVYGEGTRDVIVAMIDTGIDTNHEDLAGGIWVNQDEIAGNGIDDDGNGYIDDVNGWNFYHGSSQVFVGDEDSHGTHGAGTIRANIGNGIGIAGMVPGTRVQIMPVKALGGADGDGSTADLIRAIRYAEDNGAQICNLSLTSTVNDQALYQAIANSGMLFVVAAGNGDSRTGRGLDTDQTPYYPAAYDLDNIISVANLSFDGVLHSSSNYGAESVDLAAPGTYILSTINGNSYGYMSGTSMAAPMVSGAAAMVYSYYDGISLADVKEILLHSVTPLESLSGKTRSGGMLNVASALSYDLSLLSGTGFANGGSRAENGSAPVIETNTLERRGSMYLQIRVVDIDGDLSVLLYAEGDRTEQDFQENGVGTEFTLNGNDTATFRVGNPGTYTFYARDVRGNQTVRKVRFADMSEGPGAL